MSLQQAITDIADRIDSDVENLTFDNITIIILKGLSRELRTAVKSSEGIPPPIQQVFPPHEVMIEKEREKIRREKMEKGDEGPTERMVELVGPGSEDTSVMTMIDGRMPSGAKTVIDNRVYIMCADNRLYYSKEETEKYRQRRIGSHE